MSKFTKNGVIGKKIPLSPWRKEILLLYLQRVISKMVTYER